MYTQKNKLTKELVRKTTRVDANICVLHIDQIVSKLLTSLIKLQRHSSVFGDATIQFPNDDLELIEAIFAKASVRPRNIVLASLPVGTKNILLFGMKFSTHTIRYAARIENAHVRVPYS